MAQDCEMQSSTEDTLVGAFMPRQLIDSLDVCALQAQVSRSQLIRDILLSHVDEMIGPEQTRDDWISDTIKSVASEYFKELYNYFQAVGADDWRDLTEHFTGHLRTKLEKRKAHEELVERIVKEVARLAENFIIRSSKEAR